MQRSEPDCDVAAYLSHEIGSRSIRRHNEAQQAPEDVQHENGMYAVRSKSGPEAAVHSVRDPVEDLELVLWIGTRYTDLESDILMSVKI